MKMTGIRIRLSDTSEFPRLIIDDIENVSGKSHLQIPISEQAFVAINEWIAKRRKS